MADANSNGEPSVNPTGSDEPKVTSTGPKESGEPKQEQPDAVRKLQSERDRVTAENAKLSERLEALEGVAYSNMRDTAIKSFLKENGDKFTDVELSDLQAATSEEEFEDLAKKAQSRADRIRVKALADVHSMPDTSLSDEEAAKEIESLEKKPERNGFQKFLDIRQRTQR